MPRKAAAAVAPLPPGIREVLSNGSRHDSVVLAVAVVAIAVSALAAVTGAAPPAPALAIGLLVPAAVIDVRVGRLPDVGVGAALTALVGTLSATAAVGGDVDMVGAVVGAIVTSAPIATLHLVSPGAMGFGDVKASVVLGAALGVVDWRLGVVALCLAGLAGSTFGLVSRRDTIAFGPWLVGAALVSLVAHDPIIDWLFGTGGTR